MTTMSVVFIALAGVLLIMYLMRRRSRLVRDDEYGA